MKTLEYHLPCYDKGVYSCGKSHERHDRIYDVEINGTKYIFHYCQSCLYAQSTLSTSCYGFFVILMNYIFNECGIFEMYKYDYTNEGHSIHCPNDFMVWGKNNRYYFHKEIQNNGEYIKIDSDAYNTFYAKM
jgi:hypothetical protein